MTFEKVAKILAEQRDIDVNEITLETSFESLGLDSLDMVDLVMIFEEEFDIKIEIEQGLKTVGNVVSLIDSLLK
ncbi:MAG: acyl carrier protein [Clostridia bacterium]|jgi:acyl carrier protein|nr:acyl carrier protein [Clostridia bacterium]